MIPDHPVFWISVLLSALTLAHTIVSGRTKASNQKMQEGKAEAAQRTKTVEERTDRVSARVEKLDERMTRVESDFRHMPSTNAVHALQLDIAQLRGDLSTLTERIKPIAGMASRIEEALIEKVAG